MGTREWLVREVYPDGHGLAARRSIYDYRIPKLDLTAEVLRRLAQVNGPIIDVGCGDGLYVRALRSARPGRAVVAVDISPGMATLAGRPAVVADAGSLPFANASVAAVLAMHMLYHLRDPEAAVAELARVCASTRHCGLVLIATNAEADKRELFALRDSAIREVDSCPPRAGSSSRSP